MEFDTLDDKYRGKSIELKIDSKILTDEEFIKEAVVSSLEKVAEAIRIDVVYAKKEVFSNTQGEWAFPKGGYATAAAYYTNKMVPYWRGGLIGSFELVGSEDGFSYDVAFMAPYAELIEKGGIASSQPPVEWFFDKDITPREIKRVSKHPFMEAVTIKIEDNLDNFGYLDIFATQFQNFVR